jgi:hypothetical protein
MFEFSMKMSQNKHYDVNLLINEEHVVVHVHK